MRYFLYALFLVLLAVPAQAQTNWTGAAGTSAWCDAANWDAGVPTTSTDAFVRGGAAVYPNIDGTEPCTVTARNLDVNDNSSGGRVTVAGGSLDVTSVLDTRNTGSDTGLRLNTGIVSARAITLNGDHTGRFTGGELQLSGVGSRISGVFRPDGTLVRVTGGAQVIFDAPGIGPGQSYFEDVIVEAGASLAARSISATRGNAWFTGSLSGAGGASGFRLYFSTQLPTLTGSYSTSAATYFYGTRTLGPGQSYTLPGGNLEIGNASTSDGLGGRIRVTAGGMLTVPGSLTTYTNAEGNGLVVAGGEVETRALVLNGDASANYVGGELRLSGVGSRISGVFRPDGTLVRVTGGAQVIFDAPGIGPGQSYFEDVIVEAGASLAARSISATPGNAWFTGLLSGPGSASGFRLYFDTTLPTIASILGTTDSYFYGTRTLGPGQSYTLPGGDLEISEGGQILVGGGTLIIPGRLTTESVGSGASGSGLGLGGGLVAVNDIQVVGDHTGRFPGGELQISGSNSRFSGTFRPSGTLVRFLTGTGTLQAIMDNAGVGPGQNYFRDLLVEGTGALSMRSISATAGNIAVIGTLTMASSRLFAFRFFGTPFLASPGSPDGDAELLVQFPVTVSGVNVNGLKVSSNGRLIVEGSGCLRLDNAQFPVFSSAEPRLTIRHPGGNLEFNNLSFSTSASNFHLAIEDTAPGNPFALRLYVVDPTPATATAGTNYTEAGGAEVLWDGPELEPLPVTLALEPADAPPVIVPATGGPLTYQATLTNTSPQPQTFEARIVAILPNGVVFGPIQGPLALRVPANRTIGPVSFTDNVPAIAPAGTYGLVLEGTTLCPETNPDPAGFTFEKEQSDSTQVRQPSLAQLLDAWVGEESLVWISAEEQVRTEADEAASTTALPEAFALHTAYPNPFRTTTTLGLDVPTPVEVRVEVFDRLGRRVAVLHDGPLAAGEHALRFEDSALPSGLYVVRATDGATTLTQSITLLR